MRINEIKFMGSLIIMAVASLLSCPVLSFEEGTIAESIEEVGHSARQLNMGVTQVLDDLDTSRTAMYECGNSCSEQVIRSYRNALYAYDVIRMQLVKTGAGVLTDTQEVNKNRTPNYCAKELAKWYSCYGPFQLGQQAVSRTVLPACKQYYDEYVEECRDPIDLVVNDFRPTETKDPLLSYYRSFGEGVDEKVTVAVQSGKGVYRRISSINRPLIYHVHQLAPSYGAEYYAAEKPYWLARIDGHKILRCTYQNGTELWYWHKKMPAFKSDKISIANSLFHPGKIITEVRVDCPSSPVLEQLVVSNSYVKALERSKVIRAKLKAEQEAVEANREWYRQHGYRLVSSKKIKLEIKLSARDKKFVEQGGVGKVKLTYEELGRLLKGGAEYLECQYQRKMYGYLYGSKLLDITTQHHLASNYGIYSELEACPEGSQDAEKLSAEHNKTVAVAVQKLWAQQDLEVERKWREKKEALRQPMPTIERVERDIKELKRTHIPNISFPEKAIKKKVDYGKVTVRVKFDESGSVQKVKVIKDASDRMFKKAALEIARGTVFEPVAVDSKPVKVWTEYIIEFKR